MSSPRVLAGSSLPLLAALLPVFGALGCVADATLEEPAADGVLAELRRAPYPNDRAGRARRRNEACKRDARVRLGLVSHETCVGADLFFRETFDGNSRTCGTCHPAANNFTLDADFIASLPDDDPLFIAERDPELAELEHPDLLRRFGLITANPDGFDDPTHKFVLRSVSHTLSMATSIAPPPSEPGAPTTIDGTTTPPNHRTGWSGDGAPGNGELRDFADGAIAQHATKSLARVPGEDFGLPDDAERDAIAAFTLELGRKSDLDLSAVKLRDAGAERGRVSFTVGAGRECGQCHDNAGANMVVTDLDTGVSFKSNFSFDVGTELARLPELDALGIPYDGGFGVRPFDLDGDGVKDSFGNSAFNAPSLIEAPDTAPYFHTHAAATLEDAIRFYTTDDFGNSLSGAPAPTRPDGGPFVLRDDEIADLGRFLRVLNASFNCQTALARLAGAARIADARALRDPAIERGLLELSLRDIDDALRVLGQVKRLSVDAQRALKTARCEIERGLSSDSLDQRKQVIEAGQRLIAQADRSLGSGIAFEIGTGHLLF
jgi:cytochrome c peroxidase